jgi:hypothetical protein
MEAVSRSRQRFPYKSLGVAPPLSLPGFGATGWEYNFIRCLPSESIFKTGGVCISRVFMHSSNDGNIGHGAGFDVHPPSHKHAGSVGQPPCEVVTEKDGPAPSTGLALGGAAFVKSSMPVGEGGAPLLAFFARGGCVRHHRTTRASAVRFAHAQRLEAVLRFRRPALHHLQLLSAPGLAGYAAASRSLPAPVGRDPYEISLHPPGRRDHARALPSADQRAASRKSLDRIASAQAALCATGSAGTATGIEAARFV